MGKTVSVSELDNTIEFIHTQFMKPLETVGQSLIDQYKAVNTHLKSEEIDSLIQAQQKKLDSLREALNNIATEFRKSLTQSSDTVLNEQSEINDILS